MDRPLALRLIRIFLALALIAPPRADAQIRLIKQLSLGPRRPAFTLLDLEGRFQQQALELTPSGDLLTFSPRRDGVWELARVHGWNTSKPIIDHLKLTGYFSSADRHDLENLTVSIYVTSDGAHAICVGSAEWLRRESGRPAGKARTDSIITVVDLATFKSINSSRLKAADSNEYQSIEIDGKGRLLLVNSSFGENRHGEFASLEVPSLRVGPSCKYDYATNKQHGEQLSPITVESCKQYSGSETLEDFLKKLGSYVPTSSGFLCKDKKAEYCPQPDRFTPDHQFGLGIRSEGRDNIFGSWVQTRATAILFSTATHTEVVELDLTHIPPFVKLASVDGRSYLLLLQEGSELSVYQLPN
jgi:hypothetical protein